MTAAVALGIGALLSAQNINQSVQVTNDYITRFADFQKQGGELQVPDSLYRFDYNFDYSVFETPYRGSYEFSPYRIRVTPEARPLDAAQLYLRAGAGFALRPQLLLAWQPLRTNTGAVGVSADLSGFAGRYRTPDPVGGHDLNGRVGVNGQYLTPSVRVSGQLGYEGLFAGRGAFGDTEAFGADFSVLSLQGRVQSREQAGGQLFYDIDARYRYGADAYASGNRAVENDLRLGVSAGPASRGKYRIRFDGLFELDNVNGYYYKNGSNYLGAKAAMLASVAPHVEFLLGSVRLDAGVRLDYSMMDNAAGDPDPRFTVAPDVTVRLPLAAADVELFAAAGGGQSVQSLYDARQSNHFSYRSDASATVARERLRLRAGLDGHWGARMQYGLEAGYVSYAGKLLPSHLAVLRADYDAVYGRVFLAWKDERVEADGRIGYAYMTFPETCAAFAPPAFTADLRAVYNWQNLVHAGAFLHAASARTWLDGDGAIPGYADFGLTGEVRISRSLGAWLEAGNLFGMAIERAPGFIEKGPYITVGLSLKL